MVSDIEHLLMYLLAICMSLQKCQVLGPFLNWAVWFLLLLSLQKLDSYFSHDKFNYHLKNYLKIRGKYCNKAHLLHC